MLKHEAKLIDPDAEQIVAGLTEAAAAANKRCRARLLVDAPEKWRKFAREAAAKPEGYAMFRGGRGGVPATQVLAAWWADAAGRKHVVIRGRRVEHDEARRLLEKAELDARPPLWHAYPEYACRRAVGSDAQVVCACGCGAVGTPESLGWMGETCGPCFDRKQEVGQAGLRANLPGVLYGDREPLRVVACSPDGTRVAAAEGENRVTYWDIPTRTRTVMKFTGASVMDVAITPNGRHLLAVGYIGLGAGGLFAAFDLGTDPPTRVDREGIEHPSACRIVALPDAGLAIRQRVDVRGGARGDVEEVCVPSGEWDRTRAQEVRSAGRFALAPDGELLATCGDEMSVYDLARDQVRAVLWRDTPPYPEHVAFGPDGRLFGAVRLKVVEFGDGGKTVTEGRLDGKSVVAFNAVTALAADPAGEWVYAGSWQGKVYAFAADTLNLHAVFEWHLGAVRGLAVSADGSRLFSSGDDGCVKVWPIRDLLKGV